MSVFPAAVAFEGHFARELAELTIPWQAVTPPDPQLIVLNDQLAEELGLDPASLRTSQGLALLTGTELPDGATPVAQAYAGHQFGGYSPRLGDGRALLLGEFADPTGCWWDLHLKGSGRTPFSRGGDGLAALGPMLREYVISEAMHALGVPTTRSLAVIATGRPVQRESLLPGALLARVARSHLRVGSFQYAAATGDLDLLRRLCDYAIAHLHPTAANAPRPPLALLDAVVSAQATLLAQWMLVGFVHGVMNTDNMTISGETIDYGPCAFLDAYDPATVFSSIDHTGRYAFGNQPAVAQWNLARFAESLLRLLDPDEGRAVELATGSLGAFSEQYDTAWSQGMRTKLGLPDDLDKLTATSLTTDWLSLLHRSRADHTAAHRALAAAARGNADSLRGQFLDLPEIDLPELDLPELDVWLTAWLSHRPDADLMDRTNPLYIPRNHLVEEALTAATEGDLSPFDRLLQVVAAPYDERPGLERYTQPAPEGLGTYQTFCGT